MSDNTKKLLYVLIALLAVIKFAVQPLLEWQSELHQNAEESKKRAVRMASALETQEQTEVRLEELKQALGDLQKQYPKVDNNEVFKLEAQLQINQIAQQFGVDVDLVDWGEQVPSESPSLMVQPLTVELSGATQSLALTHTELLLQFANAQQQSASMSFRGSLLKSKFGRMQLSLDLYQRSGDAD